MTLKALRPGCTPTLPHLSREPLAQSGKSRFRAPSADQEKPAPRLPPSNFGKFRGAAAEEKNMHVTVFFLQLNSEMPHRKQL